MELRDFHISDAKTVAKLCNDNDLAKWTASIPHPYREQDAIDWISGIDTSGRTPFAVTQDHNLIGCVSMWDYAEGAVEIGYWVGKEYWGRGFGRAAVTLLLEKIREMSYRKVVAQVVTGNVASETLLVRCGFAQTIPLKLARFGVEQSGYLYELQITEAE